MDIATKIAALATRASEQLDHIVNEEATKNAMVMPFIQALGYDPFNPLEVMPEFTADVGTKKGEKVDYAIRNEGKLSILVECKPNGASLSDAQFSQLYRYFNCTEAKFAILTNGSEYRFYSDLDDTNKLDTRPFFMFRLDDYNERDIEELKKFAKPNFDIDAILSTANRLKYTNLAKQAFDDLLRECPRDFVKYLASQFYDGRMTQQTLDEFAPIIKDATGLYIKEQVGQRLKSALSRNYVDDSTPQQNESISTDEEAKDDIVTTQEEIDGYNIIRSLLASDIRLSRVVMRDAKSYCAILLDDNNRKPICRLHFNSTTKKRIGLFVDKKEERHDIDELHDIFAMRDQILATVHSYDAE